METYLLLITNGFLPNLHILPQIHTEMLKTSTDSIWALFSFPLGDFMNVNSSSFIKIWTGIGRLISCCFVCFIWTLTVGMLKYCQHPHKRHVNKTFLCLSLEIFPPFLFLIRKAGYHINHKSKQLSSLTAKKATFFYYEHILFKADHS